MNANISVIIPFFNNHTTITRALESIKNQSVLPNEVIIIDDCSSPPINKSKINSLFKDLPIKIFFIRNKKNLGASFSRNIGISHSNQEFISFLDADDSWHKDKIKIQYRLMLENNLNLTFHKYSTQKEKIKDNFKIKKFSRINFIFGNRICTPTVMAKKSTFIKFDPRQRRMEDYKCWIENSLTSDIFYIDEVLAYGYKKPIGESGLSGSVELMHLACINSIKTLRKERKINLFFFIAATSIELIKYPIRKARIKNYAN